MCWNCCDECEKTLPKHLTKDCDCSCIDEEAYLKYKTIKKKPTSYSNEIKKLTEERRLRESQTDCKYGMSCRYKDTCTFKHPKNIVSNRNFFKNRMKKYL